jgi:hypothetical protein
VEHRQRQLPPRLRLPHLVLPLVERLLIPLLIPFDGLGLKRRPLPLGDREAIVCLLEGRGARGKLAGPLLPHFLDDRLPARP